MARPANRKGLCAWVTCTQGTACHLWVIHRVGNLLGRCYFNDLNQIVFVLGLFFTLHNQHVFEALVI